MNGIGLGWHSIVSCRGPFNTSLKCGRFSLAVPLKDLLEVFGPLDNDPSVERLYAPRYKITPAKQIAAVREVGGRRKLLALKWGLVPSWPRIRPSA